MPLEERDITRSRDQKTDQKWTNAIVDQQNRVSLSGVDAGSGSALVSEVDARVTTKTPSPSSKAKDSPISGAADVVSSLAASGAGLTVFALSTRYSVLTRLACAIGIGATSKSGLRMAIAAGTNERREESAWSSDLVSGGIDGTAAVGGAIAEGWAAARYLRFLGRNAIGSSAGAATLEKAGRQVVTEHAGLRVVSSGIRGATGGFASSTIWSVAHGLAIAGKKKAIDPAEFVLTIACNSVLGGVTGGAVTGSLSALRSAPELSARAGVLVGDLCQTNSNRLSVDIFHLNDFHSNLFGNQGISRLSTRLAELRDASRSRGRGGLFVSVGDESSGNAVSPFSYAGVVENQAISRLKPTAVIPGNHSGEIGRGKKDIPFWLKYMNDPDLGSKLAANVDVVATGDQEASHRLSSQFKGIFKPHTVVELNTGNTAKERLGMIGLVTDDIKDGAEAVSNLDRIRKGKPEIKHSLAESDLRDIASDAKVGFSYSDHFQAAANSVKQLQKEGVDRIVVLSHLGMSQDIELARKIPGLSAVIGAHSHDFTPAPVWVENQATGRSVPIVQAGSSGRWLGELKLVLKNDGSADRYRTRSRLHAISNAIPEDEDMLRFLDSSTAAQAKQLMKTSTGVQAVGRLSVTGIRSNETRLGNFISDALKCETNKHLRSVGKKSVDLMLKHSGDIRNGIAVEGFELSKYDLDNVFCNGDNNLELCTVELTGKQIKDILEFSVSDLHPHRPLIPAGLWRQSVERMRSWLYPSDPTAVDHSGNFLQVSGLKYAFDLSRPPRARIDSVQLQGKSTAVPLAPERLYNVLTLSHPVEKWTRKGGLTSGFEPTVEVLGLSQPRLTESYLGQGGKKIDFNADVRIDGRITDRTPYLAPITVPPSYGALLGVASNSQRHNKDQGLD